MDEKTIKAADIPTAEEILAQIDTKPLNDAISAFMELWGEAIGKATKNFPNLYQAIFDIIPANVDIYREVINVAQDAIEILKKRGSERKKWRVQKAVKIRLLLLDKRSKIHRCRNAC